MDAASVMVGVGIGILVALVCVLFAQRSKPKASRSEGSRLERGDTGDVLTDADRRMAEGYFADAVSLLAARIAAEPGRQDFKLKLLEIYFVWGKRTKFVEQARHYRSELSNSSEWAKVEIMGRELCPEEPMFREST